MFLNITASLEDLLFNFALKSLSYETQWDLTLAQVVLGRITYLANTNPEMIPYGIVWDIKQIVNEPLEDLLGIFAITEKKASEKVVIDYFDASLNTKDSETYNICKKIVPQGPTFIFNIIIDCLDEKGRRANLRSSSSSGNSL